MKAVLISIRPKWCEAIAAGEKTIEVRKTRPNIKTPFKCYIYETKDTKGVHGFSVLGCYRIGKVIGEFVCDKIERLEYQEKYLRGVTSQTAIKYFSDKIKSTALSVDEIMNYGKGKPLYGWHISDLKIYDKPKELSEFYTIDESGNDCCIACVFHETPLEEMPCRTCTGERKYLYRPPQSYMFVEEVEQ